MPNTPWPFGPWITDPGSKGAPRPIYWPYCNHQGTYFAQQILWSKMTDLGTDSWDVFQRLLCRHLGSTPTLVPRGHTGFPFKPMFIQLQFTWHLLSSHFHTPLIVPEQSHKALGLNCIFLFTSCGNLGTPRNHLVSMSSSVKWEDNKCKIRH